MFTPALSATPTFILSEIKKPSVRCCQPVQTQSSTALLPGQPVGTGCKREPPLVKVWTLQWLVKIQGDIKTRPAGKLSFLQNFNKGFQRARAT
jgi:hypothetical protein